MERWARTMIRYRWGVLAFWIVAVIAAGAVSSGLSDLLTNRFVLPGAESEKAATILKDHFGQKPEGTFSLVARGGPNSAQSLLPKVRAAAERAAHALPTGHLAEVHGVSSDVVSASIVSQLQPADSKGHTGAMRKAAGPIRG